MSRSAYRFVSSLRSGQYSVWHGDRHIGYVTKVVHRITDRGITRTVVGGWTPSTTNRNDLAIAPTREAAADVLWQHRGRALEPPRSARFEDSKVDSGAVDRE